MPIQSYRARNRSNNRKHINSAQINRPPQFEATCSDCRESTTVPFRPAEGRPVYCASCLYLRRNGGARRADANNATQESDANQTRESDNVAAEGVFTGMVLNPATKAAVGRMGITEPTPIQEQAIPHLLEGRDLIGQARTGSGKTLAFVVPMVEQCEATLRRPQALVLVPTRELAVQVGGVTEQVAGPQGLHVTQLYGGRSVGRDHKALQRGAQIIIGTPGRTLDHVRQGSLDLRSVRFLVLDEADEMLDRGFAQDVDAILSRTPDQRQTALFSATVPDWVAQTSRKHLHDPVTVEVDAELQGIPTVEHLVYSIQKSDKMQALRMLLDSREEAPVLVFGRTKHGVKRLASQLNDLGYPVGALQGNLSQVARERVMKDFRSGAAPILIATNVAARGLDVEGIAQVINFDLPDSEQLFTHRVGRTGRMGRSGEAVTFITPDEDRKWKEIERGLGFRFTRKSWTREQKAAKRRNKDQEEFGIEADEVRLRVRR